MSSKSSSFLSRTEAAQFLKLSPASLASDATRKKLAIPFYRAGRRVVYDRTELENWLRKRKV
jgi:TfoX/Sxy family transcriptional regulator of competence genes